jgi:hypothetical protein
MEKNFNFFIYLIDELKLIIFFIFFQKKRVVVGKKNASGPVK